MDSSSDKISVFLYWITPTAIEITSYIFLTFLTIFLCSQDFIDTILFAVGDFNPIRAGVGYIDLLLRQFVGDKIAGSLSLGLFWGLVGVIVNVIWWLWSSFSTELNNDLVFSRYVHPKNTDPKSQLKAFIERSVVRAVVAIVGLLYVNYVVSSGWPSISNRFAEILRDWELGAQWGALIITALAEILMFHMLVVLTRLVLLRKRSNDA